MTVTAVGYGDITPANKTEYLWCSIFMIIGSAIWAYVVSVDRTVGGTVGRTVGGTVGRTVGR